MQCEYCEQHDEKCMAPVTTIDIDALLSTLDETGKVFLVGFTGGGEPFLSPNITEACYELMKKHYIRFNTNLAEKGTTEFLEKVTASKIRVIHASCHIKALERRKLMERFIHNIQICQKRGIPVNVEEVGYPPLAIEAEDYRSLFKSHGIELTFGPFYGKYRENRYPDSYTDQERKVFGFPDACIQCHQTGRGNGTFYCNAGMNVFVVRSNGDVYPCDGIKKKLGNIYTGFRMNKQLVRCPVANCICPLYEFEPDLYQQAKKDSKHNSRLISFLFR